MEGKDIEPEDLLLLEEELEREELVSVLFLLYGAEKPEWIYERLSNRSNKNFLYDYATHHTTWKTAIVHALVLTGTFEIVRNLGIDSEEALEDLSRNQVINPGLQILHELCEACSLKTTQKLVSYIKAQSDSAKRSEETLLEFYLLQFISSRLIVLGKTLDDCDFSSISKYFVANPNKEVKELLSKLSSKKDLLDNSAGNSFTGLRLKTKVLSELEKYPSQKMQVLIINQASFFRETNSELASSLPDQELLERKGTMRDAEELQLLFESFGYQVTVKTNLVHLELLKEVDKASRKASIGDGLIVCIMSHGHEGVVYGHNSIAVEVKDIKSCMALNGLLGKPKILFIQACQGDNLQKPVKKATKKIEYDGPAISVISGLPKADFLTFWSTIEGFASVRHVDNGSWFIQELVKKIRELHCHNHLMDICTAVIKNVSSKRGYKDECMLSKLDSTFTRNFHFPSLKSDSRC